MYRYIDRQTYRQMDKQIDKQMDRQMDRQIEIERQRGDVVVASARVPHRTVTSPEISPLLMQQLLVAELRSFSDSSSSLQLLHLFVPALSVSNLAIAIAASSRKSLGALVSMRSAQDIYVKRQTKQPSEPMSLLQQIPKISPL